MAGRVKSVPNGYSYTKPDGTRVNFGKGHQANVTPPALSGGRKGKRTLNQNSYSRTGAYHTREGSSGGSRSDSTQVYQADSPGNSAPSRTNNTFSKTKSGAKEQ